MEMNQMMELSDKNFKAPIIKMLQQAIYKLSSNKWKNIENLSKEIQVLWENQIEIIELKNTIIKRVEITKDKILGIWVYINGISPSEQQEKKINRLRDWWELKKKKI